MSRIVALYDGSRRTGGLTNRFAGIISAYGIAKHYGKKFEIKFTYPFNLEDFLVPNKYDWRYTGRKSDSYKVYTLIDSDKNLDTLMADISKDRFDIYYLYININVLGKIHGVENIQKYWSSFFGELFGKTDYLKSRIDRVGLPDNYIAIHFRFLNRLGDFTDTSETTELDKADKDKLIRQCKKNINFIASNHPNRKYYVASDSNRFLTKVKNMDNVIAIGGKKYHTDVAGGESYVEPFVDFFILSRAEKIYNIKLEGMHKSMFGRYASMINNIPFERLD